MPSYISHAIFGESLYKEIKKEKDISSDILLDDLKMFSLGADLSYYSDINDNSHNYKTKDFFIEMIKYIKKKNLQLDKNIIAYLYGHLGHYYLDKNVHPLVYYNSTGMETTSFLSPHILIEIYIDYYYSKKIKNMNLFDINGKEYCLKGNFSKDCKRITNYLYEKVYNIKNVKNSYLKMIKTFGILETLLKVKFLNKDILKRLIRFDDTLKLNNLKKCDIVNEKHLKWTVPVTGKQSSESLLQLYDKSLQETISSLKVIENYLYNQGDLSCVENIFDNSSYDTGVDCKLGKVMKYVRKIKKIK